MLQGAELCAVVKADGYGHGAVACARAALAGGAIRLAVATATEAVEVREAGIDASLLVMGAFAAVFCFFRLADIIAAMVVIRILIQFLAQIVGLLILRKTRPEFPRPFKMWLYPVPAFIALAGFLYVMLMRDGFQTQLIYASVLIVAGVVVYIVRAYKRREYPFGSNVIKNEA